MGTYYDLCYKVCFQTAILGNLINSFTSSSPWLKDQFAVSYFRIRKPVLCSRMVDS